MKAQFFCTIWPFKKLFEKYLDFYEIIAQHNTYLFIFHFPESMHSVHLVFHISILKIVIPNTFPRWFNPPSALVTIDSEVKYEISWIVDLKIDQRQACKLFYKVIWLGYEDTVTVV